MGKFTNVLMAGALAMVAFSSCSEEKKGYVIDGQVADVKEGVMYLKKYVDKTFVEVDSAVIVDGKFKFEGVVSEALAHGLTTIKASNRPQVFFLDNDAMKVTMNESDKELIVTGSPANDVFMQNAKITRSKGYNLDSLIAAHPASPVAAYFVVKDFAYKLDLEGMKAVRSKFYASLNGT